MTPNEVDNIPKAINYSILYTYYNLVLVPFLNLIFIIISFARFQIEHSKWHNK